MPDNQNRRISDDLMLSEFKHLRNDILKINKRMANMENTMASVALQSNQIAEVSARVTKLEHWNTNQANELKDIAKFQGGCVRYSFDKVVEKQWTAIKVLACTMMAGFTILTTIIVKLT